MAGFDFSQLPEELNHLIMNRLSFIGDFVRFGATCKSWESVVVASRRKHKPIFPPALMLVNDDADAQDRRIFSCLSTKREITLNLPDICGRRCWGTPYGWLITFGLDLNLHLLNPFTGVRLSLPDNSTFPGVAQARIKLDPQTERLLCVQKLSLSSNPYLDQNKPCIVIAITDRKLSFAKPGAKAWTYIETPTTITIQDAIYFNGLIHAVTESGMLIVCDVNSPHMKGVQIETTPFPYQSKSFDKFYLLDMRGELHVVVRFLNNSRTTENFLVHKFHYESREWIVVTNLEDHALFVGNNTSFSISTKDYPDFKCNAIYFTDDQAQEPWSKCCDMFVYDIKKKTLEPFYTGTNVIAEYSRPIFVIPG